MAVTRDIETQVEDAFISVLDAYSDITSTVRRWKDAANNKTYPVVAVHCSPVDMNPATPVPTTSTLLYVANVEIAVLSYGWSDTSMSTLRGQFGAVRDCLCQSGILSSLDAVSGVDVTFHGILPAGGAHLVDEDNVNQMSMTVTCYLTI